MDGLEADRVVETPAGKSDAVWRDGFGRWPGYGAMCTREQPFMSGGDRELFDVSPWPVSKDQNDEPGHRLSTGRQSVQVNMPFLEVVGI